MTTDYDILGVSEDASVEEIRRAYRTKAIKCHPDKDHTPGADERFKRLTKAYHAVFTFAKTRRERPSPVFEDRPKKSESPLRRRGSNLTVTIKATAREMTSNAVRVISINRQGICTACQGSGSETGKAHSCKPCGGSGFQGLSLLLGEKKRCTHCSGTGRIPVKPFCGTCWGKGISKETVQTKVVLNPFSEVFVIPGMGNHIIGGDPGDLHVSIQVEKTTGPQMAGLDIITNIVISPAQAILGDNITISIYGRPVEIRIPIGIENGATIEKDGGGSTVDGKTGKLRCVVKIQTPTFISKEEEELYKEILKIEKKQTKGPKILGI